MNANHCLLNSSFDDSSQRYFYLVFQQSNWHNHQKTTIKININCLDLWKINLIIAMIIKIIIIITRPSRKVFNIDEGLHPPLSCQPTSIGPSLKRRKISIIIIFHLFYLYQSASMDMMSNIHMNSFQSHQMISSVSDDHPIMINNLMLLSEMGM